MTGTNSRNTIVYEQDTELHQHLIKIFSTGISVDRVEENMGRLLCCLPEVSAPGLRYDNLFRIIIMRFIDAYDFDVRAIRYFPACRLLLLFIGFLSLRSNETVYRILCHKE
jgi:hypothetical protein